MLIQLQRQHVSHLQQPHKDAVRHELEDADGGDYIHEEHGFDDDVAREMDDRELGVSTKAAAAADPDVALAMQHERDILKLESELARETDGDDVYDFHLAQALALSVSAAAASASSDSDAAAYQVVSATDVASASTMSLAREMLLHGCNCATLGFKTLLDRADAVQVQPLGGPYGSNVSLVQYLVPGESGEGEGSHVLSDAVTLVKWKDPCERIGQIIQTDNLNRVMFSMFCYFPFRSFKDAFVIHPGCSVGVSKPKEFRAELPAHIVRLRQMWRLALDYQGLDTMESSSSSSTSLRSCAVCQSSRYEDFNRRMLPIVAAALRVLLLKLKRGLGILINGESNVTVWRAVFGGAHARHTAAVVCSFVRALRIWWGCGLKWGREQLRS